MTPTGHCLAFTLIWLCSPGEVVGVDVNASISLPKVWSNFEQQQLPPPTAYLFGDVATQQVQVGHPLHLTRLWWIDLLFRPCACPFTPASFPFPFIAVQAQLHALGPFDAIMSDPPYGKREKGSLSAKGAAQEATHTLLTLAADRHILKVRRISQDHIQLSDP